ncbi:MAG: hypothetical protein K0S27_1089 [Gammaproteobacteria bacterium]|jgi:hypothetical protein|nr:hypothetical protein [Gammaproteobacteria bacterium]
MRDIWAACHGKKHIKLLSATAWRVVETQLITATRKLVDSFEEHSILEAIIETNEPRINPAYLRYHPLLSTSFRYPPLKQGSRFGKKTEPSLWYGSLDLTTALAEKAFYLFNFLNATATKLGMVCSDFTVFSAKIKSGRGVNLMSSAFINYTKIISSPTSYDASQALGAAMRKEDVETFTYYSARNSPQGVNIALFTPKAFLHTYPQDESFQSWQGTVDHSLLEFRRLGTLFSEIQSFSIDQFKVNNLLPFPAFQ